MRIYTKSGDLAFKTFSFPDSQPHFKLETYEREFDEVTIESAIRNSEDLFRILLVSDVLRNAGYTKTNLDIRYLMGARMDRSISWDQPFTLSIVARLLNGAGFSRVRVLDVHSDVATRLIRNSVNVLPHKVVDQVRTTIGAHMVVAPDKGAIDRVSQLVLSRIVCCTKKRDMATGALSGFEVSDSTYIKGNEVLIIDDICDGGGTFVGLAKVLKEAGAKKVNLFVTHGIFSKAHDGDYSLEGIDKIYTTDSYFNPPFYDNVSTPITIPISMKEL